MEEGHCSLLRAATKSKLLDIFFQRDTDDDFLRSVILCRRYAFSSLEVMGCAVRKLSPHVSKLTGLVDTSAEEVGAVFRVLGMWIDLANRDFLSAELNPILPTLSKMIGMSWIDEEDSDTIDSHRTMESEKERSDSLHESDDDGDDVILSKDAQTAPILDDIEVDIVTQAPSQGREGESEKQERSEGSERRGGEKGERREGRERESAGDFFHFQREMKKVKASLQRQRKSTNEEIDSERTMDIPKKSIFSKTSRYIWNSILTGNEEFITSVAYDLLAMSQKIQNKIPADEIATYPLSYHHGNEGTDSLKDYSLFLNDVSRWVEVLVLSSWDTAERAKVISFFILLLEKSKNIRSYYVAMGLSLGLQSSHIHRYACMCSCVCVSVSV